MSRKLTQQEIEIIKVIFKSPNYRFKYGELERAKRMAKKGALFVTDRQGVFKVTGKGRKQYRKELT